MGNAHNPLTTHQYISMGTKPSKQHLSSPSPSVPFPTFIGTPYKKCIHTCDKKLSTISADKKLTFVHFHGSEFVTYTRDRKYKKWIDISQAHLRSFKCAS